MIKTVKDLYEHREKLSDMSDNAVKLAVKDTNDRIYKVIKELISKTK